MKITVKQTFEQGMPKGQRVLICRAGESYECSQGEDGYTIAHTSGERKVAPAIIEKLKGLGLIDLA